MFDMLLTLILTMKKQLKKLSGGVPFTQDEKDKLASITNPIVFKGRVDTFNDLPPEPKTGWMYLVGSADAADCAEYIFTDSGKWEFIGSSEIELSDYMKKTDIPTDNTPGAVCVTTGGGYGLIMNGSRLQTHPATINMIITGENAYRPIVPEHIPIFMGEYGMADKSTIPDILKRLAALEAKGAEA